jgi:hypothetical protein
VDFGFTNSVSAQKSAPTSTVTSRVVEDGGTGLFKTIMVSESSLPTHTVFKPDLGAATKKDKLPIIVWGNGACANSPWEHVNFLSEVASYGFMVIAIWSYAEGR